MAAPAPAEFGFDHDPPPGPDLFFPVEYWVPIAYFILLCLLVWRFRRTMPPGEALIYAAIGAWLGSMVPGVLIGVLSSFVTGWLDKVATFAAFLLMLSSVIVGVCALRLKPAPEHE